MSIRMGSVQPSSFIHNACPRCFGASVKRALEDASRLARAAPDVWKSCREAHWATVPSLYDTLPILDAWSIAKTPSQFHMDVKRVFTSCTCHTQVAGEGEEEPVCLPKLRDDRDIPLRRHKVGGQMHLSMLIRLHQIRFIYPQERLKNALHLRGE